jgi:hypothetical protein
VSGVLVVYSGLIRLFTRQETVPETDVLDLVFMPKADRNV